jgi:[ribosomal protein S5]-alanine N-acetyltransferase
MARFAIPHPFHVKLPRIPPMPSNLLRLRTPRLELVAATAEMLEADLCGREELAEALGVEVPKEWPPLNWEPEPIEYLIHWMHRRVDAAGWFAWYCIYRTDFQPESRTGFQPVCHESRENETTNLPIEKPSIGRQVGNLSYDTLIGGLGFLGPPNAAGETAVGYSLLANFHRQGYCTEALSALVGWAFSHAELKTLLIRTYQNHRPSIRVAEKLHFEFAGPGPEQDTVEYVLCREMWMKDRPV